MKKLTPKDIEIRTAIARWLTVIGMLAMLVSMFVLIYYFGAMDAIGEVQESDRTKALLAQYQNTMSITTFCVSFFGAFLIAIAGDIEIRLNRAKWYMN